MDAWADLHLTGLAQRQAEQVAEAERDRLVLRRRTLKVTPAPSANRRAPATERGHAQAIAACTDCPAGQPA